MTPFAVHMQIANDAVERAGCFLFCLRREEAAKWRTTYLLHALRWLNAARINLGCAERAARKGAA